MVLDYENYKRDEPESSVKVRERGKRHEVQGHNMCLLGFITWEGKRISEAPRGLCRGCLPSCLKELLSG